MVMNDDQQPLVKVSSCSAPVISYKAVIKPLPSMVQVSIVYPTSLTWHHLDLPIIRFSDAVRCCQMLSECQVVGYLVMHSGHQNARIFAKKVVSWGGSRGTMINNHSSTVYGITRYRTVQLVIITICYNNKL